jgi:uncharacterized protein YjeT (DUF2065 family)
MVKGSRPGALLKVKGSRPGALAGRSFFVFSFWVILCGVSLMAAPGLALRVAGITSSSDIMLRVFGTVLLYMGIFYMAASRPPGFPLLYRVSVYTRFSAPLLVGAFVVATKANPLIILLTVFDEAGALWTALALRADRRPGRSSATARSG